MDDPNPTAGIVGAGTMGAGIAQVAAAHGWRVVLGDVDESVARTAIDGIGRRFARQVEKQRMTTDDRDAAVARLRPATGPAGFAGCALVIEAVVERLDVKTAVLREVVPVLPADAIIATNTSSLSVAALGEAIGEASRTVGMHFFNPAPIMKLVEIVAGPRTAPAVADRAAEIATGWGKRVARAADVPGFIVNHVARPYYLEAFRILADGHAAVDEIDETMRTVGGFRMGPFELTDLIGQDVNTATTRSVWEQLGRPPLLHPSPLQEQLVAEGRLGRKSGRGAYDYGTRPPRPALAVGRRGSAPALDVEEAAAAFTTAATAESPAPRDAYVFARILAALIVQATLAHERGVADRADIDTALRFGTNYPHGPFAWLERIGVPVCGRLLAALDRTTDDRRFVAPPSLLRDHVG